MDRAVSSTRRASAVLLLATVLSGCDSFGTTLCTGIFVYGLVITAVDAESGMGVSEELSGVAIRGSDSAAMEVDGNTLWGAGEQAGVYSVVVSAPGYELWTRTGVVVDQDECHVIPVRMEARLDRRPVG